MKGYNFKDIEKKWIDKWTEDKIYEIDLKNDDKPKFYNLAMFPYPSGASLHIGHAFTFGGIDSFGRFKKLMGYNVFQPFGFDAFGIHGENYAIKVDRHPTDVLEENISTFKSQMSRLATLYNWEYEVNTTYPDYYKWTQWLFLKLYDFGLAERKKSQVNWCPSCKTVLSDEQVIQGQCERCESVVEKKDMLQWFFKISDYADRLLKNHDKMDWSSKTLTIQKNWIGKSIGVEIKFNIDGSENSFINVFTTRPDTIFGVTFLTISTKHPLINSIDKDFYKKAEKVIKEIESQTEVDTQKNKLGVFTGLYGINPINQERVPIYISNYVLSNYGTGSLMGVPAHDSRDYDFAKKYNLPVKKIMDIKDELIPFENEGVLINSDIYNNMLSEDARESIIDYIVDHSLGEMKVNYKLRDWLISRQRYWGPPIPIIYCDVCGIVPVPESDLPVFLPNVEDFKPKGDGKSPLASIESFVNVECPKCHGKAKRETDVIDNFVDSSWYFLRYPSAKVNDMAFDPKITKEWLPVDMYIGGNEHAVLHLMYTRFIIMALYDMHLLDFDEPFKKFRAHGLLIKDGAKMSKSKGNVLNPIEIMDEYGTDVLRLHLLFIAPFVEGGNYSDENIPGINRFLSKVWNLQNVKIESDHKTTITFEKLDYLINDITENIESLKFNIAISRLMEYINFLYKNIDKISKKDFLAITKDLLIMLSVFAPFISQELWEILGGRGYISNSSWPKLRNIKIESIILPVQINGKVRAKLDIKKGLTEDNVIKVCQKSKELNKYLTGKTPKKVIFIKDKIINFIIL